MKKFIYLIVSLVNAGITALCLYLSPYAILPIHYGINGYADRYSSKWEIMIFSAIPVIFGIIYLVYSIIAEKKGIKNRKVTDKVFLIAFVYILSVLWYVMILCLQCKAHMSNSYFAILAVIMGGMFLAFSNFMPKARQNTMLGIRTKSTLSSPTVWNKTHRLAGILGVIGSIALIICGIMGTVFEKTVVPVFFIGIGIYLISGFIIPCIYANVIANKERNNG